MLGVSWGELIQGLVRDILTLINNDAEVHEFDDRIVIHPRRSYKVEPIVRLLRRRGFELVGRKVFGNPRMSANYHDYYEGGGVKVELYYAVDALVFTDIRSITITTPG